MKLSHPYQWLSDKLQNRAFNVMLPLTLLAMFIEQVTGAPSGIISFEFAGTLSVAQTIEVK